MNTEHFLFLYQLNKVGTENLVDSSDLLNYHYTCLMFILFFSIVSIKQYILNPIQCWVPPEFSKSWEEYAENYCWVQPTYVVPYEGRFPMKGEKNQKFNYYQWVPFMLLLQMCLSLLPYFLWTKISRTVGLNFDSVMKIIKKEKLKMESSKTMDETILEISRKLNKVLKNRWLSLEKTNSRLSLNRIIIPNKLFTGYIFIKFVFIIFAISQIVIMKYFIGNVNFTFGWDIITDLINGNDWKKTNLFPRISGCDVAIRRSGQPIRYSFLCALPINMLNEKIYIFLWFWMILCIIASLFSLLLWLYKTLSIKQKKKLILRLLIANRGEMLTENSSEEKINIFIKSFLKMDGIFIIEMISQKFGDVIAACLLDKIYEAFENIP